MIIGKDSPSPPPAPDYGAAAQAQGAANLETAKLQGYLNNPNIFTPYGSQTVTWGNYDNNQPQITQTLNPQAQQTLDAQMRTQTALANLGYQGVNTAQNVLGTPFSFNGPGVQTSINSPGQLQNQIDTSGIAKMPVNAGTTAQQAIMSRLEPSLQKQRTSTETQLINQGLRPGGEAYDNAATLLGQQENDARQQAVLQGLNLDMSANAQGFGQAQAQNQTYNAAQNQQYNQNLQSGQFANTAQQQALAQALQQRQMPLNEITALMSGSQIQNPQFQPYQGSNIAQTPVMQGAMAQGQAGMNMYNAQQGANNAMTSGLFSLGAGGLMGAGQAGGFGKLFGF